MKFLKYWFPVILYCCMIFVVSSIPGNEIPSAVSVSDKLIHMTEYAILALLVARAYSQASQRQWGIFCWVVVIAFVAFYGITDEFHQSFVLGRSSDLHDWFADLTGGGIGAAVYLFWKRLSRKKISNCALNINNDSKGLI